MGLISGGLVVVIVLVVAAALFFGTRFVLQERKLRLHVRRQEVWAKANRRYQVNLNERQLSDLFDRAHATMLSDGRRLRYNPLEHEVSMTRASVLR